MESTNAASSLECVSVSAGVAESKEDPPPDGLSKKQRKRLAKLAIRKEKWLNEKPQRRARERQKKKERIKAAIDRGEPPTKRRKKIDGGMENSACRVRVAIDVSFDYLMADKDVTKTCKQLMHCYASNRKSSTPMQVCLTSFNDKTKAEMVAKHNCHNWDLKFHEESYDCIFKKEDIVYLTSESPNILDVLDDTKVYIIGGFVDHNLHKGHCLTLANEKGVSHARLPIEEYLKMHTRKVLTINHVFEILLKVAEGSTWAEALMEVIPQRKGAEIKDDDKIREDEMDKPS